MRDFLKAPTTQHALDTGKKLRHRAIYAQAPMDTKKLHYFTIVAEELSISKAARRLGMGQPALSRAIRDLEERVGSALFTREANHIRLSAAGTAFLPRAAEAIEAIEAGLSSVREVAARQRLALDIGYLPSSYEHFVGDALSAFCQTFPKINLTPHPMNAGPMIDHLRAGKLDVALAGHSRPELADEFDVFKIRSIPLRAVVAEHHPAAKDQEVELSDFADSPLVSLCSSGFPGRHELIMSVCRKARLRPISVHQAEDLLSALAHIASSEAFSIMPAEVQSLATSHVRFLAIRNLDASIEFHALVRKDESRKELLTLLQECRRIALAKEC